PNAGKSTLVSRISSAHPKIADYPFTTLEPHLGVVGVGEFRSFVVADIPGLIEGGHQGHGLGDQFLKHLERTKVLVHLVAVSHPGRAPVEDYKTIQNELRLYNPELGRRAHVVVASKIDSAADRKRVTRLRAMCTRRRLPFHRISSVTGEGIPELVA